jgi:hypothetical protein
MKNIKTVKSKTTKTAIKASAAKTPAAVRASKVSVKRAPASTARTIKPAVATAVAVKAPQLEITNESIAARAYILWEKQGRPHGHDVANWLLAESQLKQEIQTARN